MNMIETGDLANVPRYKVFHVGRNFLLGCLALTFLRMRKLDKAHYRDWGYNCSTLYLQLKTLHEAAQAGGVELL